MKWDDAHNHGDPELSWTRTAIAQYMESQGRFGEAGALYERSFMDYESRLGAEHSHTMNMMKHCADVYRKQGRCNEAMYGRALIGMEK